MNAGTNNLSSNLSEATKKFFDKKYCPPAGGLTIFLHDYVAKEARKKQEV